MFPYIPKKLGNGLKQIKMSIPNLIPHKTLYISGYIYSYYAFVFIFEFPEHISKHILQFHAYC